jgi:hypothetical protein
MGRGAVVAVLAVAVLALAVPAAASAMTWTVTTTADGPPAPAQCTADGNCPTIRDALTAAGPGDTIVIPARPSHYSLTQGELTVSNPVSIVGGGAGATVIDAGGSSRVVRVSAPPGTATALSGLTLTGGAVNTSGPSQGGAGLLLESGSLGLTAASISGNSVTINPGAGEDGGGGILVLAGALTLTSTSVDGNSLSVTDPTAGTDGGGGIYAGAGSSLTVTGSTVAENTARITVAGGSSGGAGIYDASGSSRYVNDTLSSNSVNVTQSAGNGGGAIFHEGAPGTISNVTIAQNVANGPGGGIFDNAGAYTLKNTIVANNGTACAGPGGMVSAGFNLEGSNTCAMTMPTDLRNTNPRLGPLAANGGPTLTQALTPASPAIDAGACTDASGAPVAADQRGVARPQPPGGRCDIGAVEYQPASPAPLVVGGSRPVVLGSTRAAFAGVVNPGGLPSTAWFQYGLDRRYRSGGPFDHATRKLRIAGGYAPAGVSAAPSGLVPAALYHVRLVVVNSAGMAFGPDQTFVTATDRSPPAPVLGRFVIAAPAGGLVRVRIGRSFVPLTEPRRLRVGTVLDARLGAVVVRATGATGTFSGAVFRVTQPARGPLRGLATASLADGSLSGVPGYRGCQGRPPRVLQTLHATVIGRFRVGGRFSAAVARAAQWTTSDRCDGTLTAVRRGPVRVTNLRRHVTVTVRPGRSYLARR